MQPSMFNLRVPLPAGGEVFLMNTLTDAQLVVSADVAQLLDRSSESGGLLDVDDESREALALLTENGFLVADRNADRQRLDDYLHAVKTDTPELHLTVLTRLPG